MKKILISGLTGFFGTNFYINSKNKKNIYYFYNRTKLKNFKKTNCLKLSDKKINKKILKIKPKVVVHAAAITNLEECYLNKKKCLDINYKLTKKIVSIAKTIDAKLVFISTDSLSDGKKAFYKEKHQCKTLNYYSYCKLKSENFIKKNCKNHLIIRTNFFGYAPSNRKSLLDFICNNLSKKKKIYLFKNIFFTPISISNLIKVLSKLITLDKKGIYNVCGNERISKYQFGLKIAKIFNFDKNLIIKSKLIQQKLKRPLDMSLSNKKIRNLFGNNITSNVDDQLKDLKKMYKKNKYYRIKNSLNI